MATEEEQFNDYEGQLRQAREETAALEKAQIEEQELNAEPAPEPGFPAIMMMFAVLKDLIDLITLGLTGIFTTPLFLLAVGFWMLNLDIPHKNLFFKKAALAMFGTTLIGLVPVLSGVLFESTYLIWRIHKIQKKVSKRGAILKA